jgi:hypothetical protein
MSENAKRTLRNDVFNSLARINLGRNLRNLYH